MMETTNIAPQIHVGPLSFWVRTGEFSRETRHDAGLQLMMAFRGESSVFDIGQFERVEFLDFCAELSRLEIKNCRATICGSHGKLVVALRKISNADFLVCVQVEPANVCEPVSEYRFYLKKEAALTFASEFEKFPSHFENENFEPRTTIKFAREGHPGTAC
jgi:hypothetical protein